MISCAFTTLKVLVKYHVTKNSHESQNQFHNNYPKTTLWGYGNRKRRHSQHRNEGQYDNICAGRAVQSRDQRSQYRRGTSMISNATQLNETSDAATITRKPV